MNNFFEDKFNVIYDYIQKNKSKISEDDGLANVVREKLRQWVTLASFLAYDDLDLEEFFNRCQSLGIDGLIKLYSDAIGRGFYLDPNPGNAPSSKTDRDNHIVLGPAALLTIKEFTDAFEAKVVDIS